MMLCPAASDARKPLDVAAFDRVNAERLPQIAPQDRSAAAIGHQSEYTGGTNSYGSSMTTRCMAIADVASFPSPRQPDDAAIAYRTRAVSAQAIGTTADTRR